MPIKQPTLNLRAELVQPTVMNRAQYSNAAATFRPQIARMKAQVSRMQELLIAVDETEDNPTVRSKLVHMQAAMRNIDRRTIECEKQLTQLSGALREFFTVMLPDLQDAIDNA